MNNLQVIERNNERVLTTQQLADVYETDVNNIQANFNRNKDRFKENIHYFLLQGEYLKEFKNQPTNSQLVSKHSSQLYLWTERGANRHCKILDTDKAWEQFDNLEETYFKVKQHKPTCIEDVLIESLKEMKDLRLQVNQANSIALEAKTEVETIKDVVSLDSNSWRTNTHQLIARIAKKQGGFEHINMLRTESYELLNKRFGVDLHRRLINKRRKMAEEGVSESKREKVNNLDVIQDDKKLIEGYVAIVKDMALKYGISSDLSKN
ncbi:TPA: ORF6N domain-containing protein [Clostridioides difficile]|uniref:Phage protein n=18 Tax=Clostridioides difficile TaxID=1496 RepID=Q18AA5_CLOD6|nr:ORF6N domain-containing protein [Clostridioides difficile]AJP10583.1 putative phage protein [Peptoclostridium phage p630P1] [Clostridioides difficile 630]ARE61810.1 putative phage protein [Peptoclostridium phage p630P1] [Clostridioides difficile]EGT3745327.1 ORF6N domain-containing protein [Clostridioides difficile]EGT3768690.1 ORF6N domain-containing protein [Clostridioides difficile]EGT4514980.1 ORF6N domain-containing protein [Clostridioides difficile]